MLKYFSIERVNKAPSSFDLEKLQAFQLRAMQEFSFDVRTLFIIRYLMKAGWFTGLSVEDLFPHFLPIVQAAGDRIRIAADILEFDYLFFMKDYPLRYDEKAFEKRIAKVPGAHELLAAFRNELASVEPFTAKRLEQIMHAFVEKHGIKIGDIIHAVRVAVTGKPVGFGLFDTLAILGRERCLARIDRALEIAAGTRTLNSGTN
jgi:glutamyl-tRNA synthetase